MKSLLVMLGFGVPAVLALLAIGGDLSVSQDVDIIKPPANDDVALPEDIKALSGNSPIRQRIRNWEYRHFDPELGVFDWFARGIEAIPKGEDSYDVKKPEVLFSSFTTTTPILKKTLTKMKADGGRIKFGEKYMNGNLTGSVTINNLEMFTPRGLSEITLRTQNLDIKAATSKKGKQEPAAEFRSSSLAHFTGPSFEVFAQGGMEGRTELNRIVLKPPVTMHLATSDNGLFFGKKSSSSDSSKGRKVDVESAGPLLVIRLPEQNMFIMTLTGGVIVRDGDISLESETLGAALGAARAVEKASAKGKIVVRQGGEDRILGDEIKWDVESGRTVITGERGVIFLDGDNVLTAKKATLMEDRKQLVLEGGVKAKLKSSKTIVPGSKTLKQTPNEWKVECEKAIIYLSDEGGSLEPENIMLFPADGGKVLISSSKGEYRLSGGLVRWDASNESLEVRQNPELKRGASDYASSDSIVFDIKNSQVVLTGNVSAKFAAANAAWHFKAGKMIAQFETADGGKTAISKVNLNDSGKMVEVEYAGSKGSKIKMFSEVVEWDAGRQTAVMTSFAGTGMQRLESGKDWIEARKVTFSPDSRSAVFEGEVKAHLEEESAGKADALKQRIEPPYEMNSDKLTLKFSSSYEVSGAHAERNVSFTSGSGGMALRCESATYKRGDSVLFESRERPELQDGKNIITAGKILIYLTTGRSVFLGEVRGNFASDKGSSMKARCDKMVAIHKGRTAGVREVFFEDNVIVEVEDEKTGSLAARGELAVYDVEKGEVSLVGKPVVVTQKAVEMREEKIVYDLKEKVLFTRPGTKGYNWEIDPSGWKKK